jgi:hypothetical protein
MTMREHLRYVPALSLFIGVLLGNPSNAVGDPVVSSDRLTDTYVHHDSTQLAPQAVVETTFLPLPPICPRTPAGRVRWDLCG